MSQWLILFKKEWLEMSRNFKLLWMPLVFILLGIMQPVTSYYLPQILKAAGELPEGAVFDIPMPSSAEVLVGTLGQYSQIGVLVLALGFMGIIAGERSSGVAGMILVKPVSFTSYITAKWLSAVILTGISFFLGMLASWYYTKLLIGDIAFSTLLNGSLVYFVWLAFLITVTVLFSSFLKSSGIVAFVTIIIAILLSAITSLLSKWMTWSPANLSGHSYSIFMTESAGDHFTLVLTVSLALIIGLLILATQLFSRKELTE
jgi:ABC-2 type transport system permease protein